MTRAPDASELVEDAGLDVVRVGARVGIAAYGVTHLLVAWLALQLAFGGSGRRADQSGAFQTLASGAFGRVLLWVLTGGFVAVTLWLLWQAGWGFRYLVDRTSRLRRRLASGGRALVFATLAVLATRAALGGNTGGGGERATAGVLGLPGGRFVVAAVGLAIVATGVVIAWQGWTKRFLGDMRLPVDRGARRTAEWAGRIGFIAKGAAVILVGVLVVLAAVQARPQEASGLDAAMRTLAAQPYGVVMLVAAALGLAAYGVFCAFDARYHRVGAVPAGSEHRSRRDQSSGSPSNRPSCSA